VNKQDIQEIIEELGGATIEMMEASKKEDQAKIAKSKARKRLQLARQRFFDIQFDYQN
jgi:hypothetical protein